MKIIEKILVKDPRGLNPVSAVGLVLTANQFECEITVRNGLGRTNARSIMGLLALMAIFGVRLDLTFEGDDADKARKAVRKLFEGEIAEKTMNFSEALE